jgi:hypothetical protein
MGEVNMSRAAVPALTIAHLLSSLKVDVNQAITQLPKALAEFEQDLQRSGDLGEMKSVAIHDLFNLRTLVLAMLRPIDRALTTLGVTPPSNSNGAGHRQ